MELRNWRGEDLKKLVKFTAAQRMEVAAILLKNAIKEDLSEPFPPASEPGEPAHKRTGRYRASISHEVDKEALTARVGSNLLYAKFLELGTVNMAARPVLRKNFNEHFDKLRAIMRGENA
jgi:HK97 gp10 family phage protein